MRRYIDERLSRKHAAAVEHSEPEEKPLDIHEILNKFWRRRKLFLYVSIILFLLLAYKQVTKPHRRIYRATFDVGIAQEKSAESIFSGSQGTNIPTVQIGSVTQRVISSLLSVNLAEKVVENLSLYAFLEGAGSDVKVDAVLKSDLDPAFGPLKVKIYNGTVSIFQDGEEKVDSVFGQASIFRGDEKVADGILNEYIDLGFCDLKITALNKDALDKTYELKIFRRDRMAIALRNSLSIRVLGIDNIEKAFGSSGVPFSGEGLSKQLVVAKSLFAGMNLIGILRIDVLWGNPTEALRIARSLADQLIIENRVEKSQQFMQSRAFIESQLALYQGYLTRQEEEIRRFKERKNISDLGASTQALIAQVSQLESIKNQRMIEQSVLVDLNKYLSNPASAGDTAPNYAVSMVSDEMLRSLYSELLQSEAEHRSRLKEYSSNHPKVMEIRHRLDGLKEQLREEVGKRTSAVSTEISSYNTQINRLQGRLDNVPQDEMTLAGYERDRATAENLYTLFAEKLEEAKVQEAGVTSDLRILNPPAVSYSAVNPRGLVRSVVISLVMALMAGLIAVFVVEYLDNTIKNPESAMKKVGLPLFESIPAVENEVDIARKKRLISRLGFTDIYDFISKNILGRKEMDSETAVRILNPDMNTPEFEAFRKLVVNLDFVHPYKKYRVLYITSAGPEEGKTFLALNLGYVIGTMGKKVMMIDTDFRKKMGHLTEVTRLKKELGLFDILMGAVEPQDVTLPLHMAQRFVKKQDNGNIDLLPLGKIPPNPFAFLESDKMKNLIADLKNSYDYLVIDGVPLLLFADATYLANYADGVLLAARYGKTTVKELEDSRDILLNSRCNIIGVVMNDVPKTRGSYYYHRYYKYYSKYYKTEKA